MVTWSLRVKGPEGQARVITVEENCLVDDFIKATAEEFRLDSDRVQVVFTRKTLEKGKGKKLSDYNIQNDSFLFLTVRCSGGKLPGEDDDEDEIPHTREVRPLPGYIEVTDQPDEILGGSGQNAKMPCGHVISSESMTAFMRSQLDDGKSHIFCPLKNGDKKCGATWDYFLIRHVACYTADERRKVEATLAENFMMKEANHQQCPTCNTYCERMDKNNIRVTCYMCSTRGRALDFCWSCLSEWKGGGTSLCGNQDCDGKDPRIRYLADAPEKEIDYVKIKCPSTRACPKCGILIEHASDCKHMDCLNCSHKFCFICLKPDGTPSCGGYSAKCSVAPRQTEIPGAN